MFLELCKKLDKTDKDLSIFLKTDGCLFSVGVMNEFQDILYSFTSSDALEAYTKTDRFIECLSDSSKMDKLIKEILSDRLAVADGE